MNVEGRRLANVLSRLLAVLMGVSAIGLVALIPATLLVLARPDIVVTGADESTKHIAADLAQNGVAPTVLILGIGFLVIMLIVLINLRQIMRTVAAGMPFAVANITRLRTIAAAMAALLIGQVLTGLLLSERLRQASDVHGGFNAGLFLSILVVLVLAEVFREGARLHDDVEGTI